MTDSTAGTSELGTYEPDDARLLNTVRAGDSGAFDLLWDRHERAIRRLATEIVAAPGEIDEVVAETYSRVRAALQRGGGPSNAFRPYVLTALRRVSHSRMRGQRGQPPADDVLAGDPGEPFVDPAVAGLESSLVARAFQSLPERWSAVLWHTEIEQAGPGEVAALFGLSRGGVMELRSRATDGLRQAYLQMHGSRMTRPECLPVAERMSAFIRDDLPTRDITMVAGHLAGCAECRAVYGELTDVNAALRGVVAPLVLGSAATAYLAGVAAGDDAPEPGPALSPGTGPARRFSSPGARIPVLRLGPPRVRAAHNLPAGRDSTAGRGSTAGPEVPPPADLKVPLSAGLKVPPAELTVPPQPGLAEVRLPDGPPAEAGLPDGPWAATLPAEVPADTTTDDARPAAGSVASGFADPGRGPARSGGPGRGAATAPEARHGSGSPRRVAHHTPAAAGAAGAAGLLAGAVPLLRSLPGLSADWLRSVPARIPMEVPRRLRPRTRRARLVAAGAGVAVLLVAGAVVLAVSAGGGARPASAQLRVTPAPVVVTSAAAPPAVASPVPKATPTATVPAPALVDPPAARFGVSVWLGGHGGFGFQQVDFQITNVGTASSGPVTVSISLPAGTSRFGGRGFGNGGGPGGGSGGACQPGGSGITCQYEALAVGGQVQGSVSFALEGRSACGGAVEVTASSGAASDGSSASINC